MLEILQCDLALAAWSCCGAPGQFFLKIGYDVFYGGGIPMKKTTKLLLAVLLVAVLCLSLAACDNHEHTYGDWTLTIAPTLTTEGSATRTCTGCGETETVTVPALTDTSVWTATPNPAPTHTSAGKTDYTSVYGKVTVDVEKLGDEHVFDQKVVDAKYLKSEATCTEAAVYYYSCVCGESSKDHGGETFTNGEALGHSYKFDLWKTTPTLTAGGVAQMKCETCGDLKDENVASLADETVWTNVASKHIDATCTAEGKDVYASENYGEVEVVLAKLAHSYAFVSWATEPTLTEGGVANLKCANCTDTKTENIAKLSDATVWTATVTAATYEADGYTTYTATIYGSEQKFTITDENSRLVAAFEGKLYKGGMLFASHSTFASDSVFIDIGTKGVADDTFYKKNSSSSSDDGDDSDGSSGYGTGTYSNQKIKFAVVDAAKGTITVTFTWTETNSSGTATNHTEVFNGYMSADGKYIVFDRYNVNDTSAGFSAYYVLVQVDSKDTAVSLDTTDPYDTNVGKVVGLTVGNTENIVFKYNSAFYFGATLSDLTGETLTVAQSKTASNVVVKDATGARITGFVLVEYQDDEGKTRTRFAETDGLDGTYANGDETAVLDGNGKITISKDNYSFEGTYKRAEAGAAYTLDVFVEDGTSKAYYKFTLGENYTYTRVKPTGTINYVLNEGTLGAHETEINIGVAYTLPTPTREGYFFAGWYLTAEPENIEEARTDVTIALGQKEITVYAIWTKPVKVVYNGLIEGGTLETTINVGEAFLSKAPAEYIVDVTLNSDKTKGFKGWYFDAEFGTQASEELIADLLTYSDQTINLYAKWEDLATVTLKYGHLIADKETRLVKNAQFGKALAAEDNLKYNNGRPFEAWYVDVNKNGVIDGSDYAVDDGTLVAEGMVFIAKWNENVSWKIDTGSGYTFAYDAADGQWKSNNQEKDNTTASLKIFPIGGDIEVSFKFWASSESADRYDYGTVYYYATAETSSYTSAKFGGKSATAANAKEYSISLSPRSDERNAPLYFTYQKDNSGKGGSDTAYIVDLTINGVKVTAAGSPDFLDGYYTSEGGEQLTLNGFGGLTLGDETGTYTLAGANAGYTAIANVGGKAYKLTLNGSTYSLAEYNATISFNFGDIEATLANATVPFGSTYTLPEGPSVSGYIFRGWYTEAALTNKVTSITVNSEEIVLYAKYDAAVTITYNYLDGGAHANDVENLFANDKSAAVPTVDFKFGTKVFAGWFTANGTEGGDWGTEFTNGTTVTESIIVYAKWVEPHALAGTYKGAEFDPSESSIALTSKSSLGSSLVIDDFGNVTGTKTGTIENYNAENGTFVLVAGSNRYNGYADIANGIVEFDYYSGKSTNEHDIYLFVAVNGDVTPSSAESVSWTKGTVKIATVKFSNDTTKNLLVYNRVVYANVTWTATDSSGAALTTMSDIQSKAYVITVTAGENTYSFARNSSNDAVAQDGSQGTFTCDGKQDLVLNGAGIASGALNGTYTAASEGAGYTYDITTTDGQYKVTITDGTYTVEDNRITITFVNELKEIASVTPFYGKSTTLPSGDDVAVEGYKFRGWYDNAEFTGSAKTTVTLKADATYYAKYDAIVDITFDYSGYEYETGKTTKVVNTLAIGDTLSNTIPTVDATIVFEGKVFAGWFAKSGDDWGEQATSSTKITAAVTYYAKWVKAPEAYGTFKGWNMDEDNRSESKAMSDMSINVLTVDTAGKYSGNRLTSGTLTDEQAAITDGSMILGRYVYFNKAAGIVWYGWNASTTSVGNDTMIGFDSARVNKASIFAVKSVVNGATGEKYYALWIAVEYTGGTTKLVFCYEEKVIYDVSFSFGETTYTDVTKLTKATKMNIVGSDGNVLYVYENGSILVADGLDGTYTGDYGEIVVDGYGTLTIGGETVSYTSEGKNISFIAANAMRTVALGDGTYTKVEDAYKGTYTLPDNAGTIALDGFGGAGNGKTYVVSGSNITIFDGETSTAYGLDVANKALLGKSKFAGYVFTHDAVNAITFNDSSDIAGVMTCGNTGWTVTFADGVVNGNELTVTVTAQVGTGVEIGSNIVFTISGNTLTIKSGKFPSYIDTAVGYTYTCEGFSL